MSRAQTAAASKPAAGQKKVVIQPPPPGIPRQGGGGRGRTALVLAGGGLTGGIYQVGVLRALDDILVNRSMLDFDIYVGTSAGAFVATLLAAGIPPWAIAEAARNPSLGLQLRLLQRVFSPNFAEVGERLRRLPFRLPAMLSEVVRHRGSFLVSDLLAFASLVLPSGLLDSRQLSTFMRELMELAEVPTEFSDLGRELHVIACQFDTWERVVFGKDTQPQVSIPDAVAASAAIPLLFRPVRLHGADYVDGGTKGTAAIDVAIDHGADLVVVVNPLVPLDTRGIRDSTYLHRFGTSIGDLGVRTIANQLARGMIHDNLTNHVRLLAQTHPQVDVLLIEPQPSDEKMFFHEVMSTSARMVVAQHGYESVLEGMHANPDQFMGVLARHGIEVSGEILDAKPWSVPVKVVEEGGLAERLEGTIFRQKEPAQSEGRRFERAMERFETQVASGVDPQPPRARSRSRSRRTPKAP